MRVAVSLYFGFSAYHNPLVILDHYSGQSRQRPQQGGDGDGRRSASPIIDDHIGPIADLERGRVAGVKLEMEDVHVGNKFQIIDDQLDHIKRPLSLQFCSTFLGSDLFTGNHLRDRFLRWLSPSDPSANHKITRNAYHNGTAQWFLQGSIYNRWKSSGSFLWVCGQRALLLVFSMQRPSIIPYFHSWFGEKCALVCSSSTHSVLAELTPSIQFLNHTRYHSPERCWTGLDGLLLF